MKIAIPEIAWHNKTPVFSADFTRKDGEQWRLATAGADSDVKMWRVVPHRENKEADITFLSNLHRHTNTVNCVRFSPDGAILASAGDDGAMFLWHEKYDRGESMLADDETADNKEHWVAFKMLRGHIEDVMDLSWSPDSKLIVSGSIDNSAIIWDVKTGKKLCLLKEHSHYVQGVIWDPLGYYVCTLSSDRSLLVYEGSLGNLLHTVSKYHKSKECKEEGGKLSTRMFVEEGATKYFRRLDFTPDGAFLIVPAGQVITQDDIHYTTLLFARSNLKRPICHLPGPKKPVCAVKCCPVLYSYRQPNKEHRTTLPYRMVYAVASLNEVFVYDTEQFTPICTVSDIHYACITDLAWSSNGRVLLVTSYDGFCTLLTFDQDELGETYQYKSSEVNQPRMILKPDTKSHKKKKKSTTGRGESSAKTEGSSSNKNKSENENPNTKVDGRTPDKSHDSKATICDSVSKPDSNPSSNTEPDKKTVIPISDTNSCNSSSCGNKGIFNPDSDTQTSQSNPGVRRINLTKVDG